jgi:myo-inositol 2-dehydrogenase/D-chiro-inositol 1-dehydrogenase
MKPIEVAVVGTGWCGGIRAETLAVHPLVKGLHLAEIREDRLEEIERKTRPTTATTATTMKCPRFCITQHLRQRIALP